jgi:L-lactate dehydrogenase complex protein LldG
MTARNEILKNLKRAPRTEAIPRPAVPPLNELALDQEQLIEKFSAELTAQTGNVHRCADVESAVQTLTDIATSKGLQKVMASSDAVVKPMALPEWGEKNGIQVLIPDDFESRDEFKRSVFDDVDAGITGADFAIAESGSLFLIHDRHKARLISLAPIIHIAILPKERLYAVYESVIEKVYRKDEEIPSHCTFITGPSATADIQGVPFKGMHGPKQLEVILIG